MSNTIDIAHIQMFQDSVMHLLDQEGSELMPTVRMETADAKFFHFERLGRGTVRRQLARNSMIEIGNIPHSRRRSILETFFWAEEVDKLDIHRILIDPVSNYVQAAVWDLGIEMDQIIVDAISGTATSVDANDTGSQVALPTSQIIDEDFGLANSNLTVAKLRQARQLITRHSGNMGAARELHIVVNASAINSLLAETEVTSSDFNTVKALVQGEIDSFLGFKFHILKDGILPGVADGTDTDPVLCLCYAMNGVGLVMSSRGIDVEVDRIPQMHNNFLIQGHMDLGAVRLEEEKVVAIECVQAAV